VALDEQAKGVLVARLCPCDRNRIAIVHHLIRRRYSWMVRFDEAQNCHQLDVSTEPLG
jgi:hypothetical protein